MDEADGRYAIHAQKRRATDRLPEREQPRYSAADVEPRYSTVDVEYMLAEGYRRALEMGDSEPTGVQQIDSDGARAVRAMHPSLSWWNMTTKTLTGILLLAGVVASFWGGCVAMRTEMDHAVTLQAAPIRKDIADMKVDLREILRRIPETSR